MQTDVRNEFDPDKFQGNALLPGTGEYEEARKIWNGVIDRRPAAILRCHNADQVQQAVDLAKKSQLPTSIRGGGHNVAGSALVEDGLVIDLSEMRTVQVDPEERTVQVEGGALWADVDRATQAHGLAVPGGVVSDTGVAGLTLGGGIGWLRRKYGLSCDNMLSAQIVTADGQRRTVSFDQNADLFWALRGGGGGFGPVTQFKFQAHPVGPEVMFTFVFYPAQAGAEVLRAYDQYCQQAPDDVSSFAICGIIPDEEPFPSNIHGEPYVMLAAMHAGSVEEGRRVMQPLRDITEPLLDFSQSMEYTEVQQILDEDYPEGGRYYWKSLYLDDLKQDTISEVLELSSISPSRYSTVDLWHLGGAVDHGSSEDSAFAGRGASYLLGVEANWFESSDDDANIEWARQAVRQMADHSDLGLYLNFPGFEGEKDNLIERSYQSHMDRLRRIKQRYDPQGLFVGAVAAGS